MFTVGFIFLTAGQGLSSSEDYILQCKPHKTQRTQVLARIFVLIIHRQVNLDVITVKKVVL
jgi:hypothetical protein